jgi:hypothetical protein
MGIIGSFGWLHKNNTTVDKIVAEIYNSFVVVLEHGGASIK